MGSNVSFYNFFVVFVLFVAKKPYVDAYPRRREAGFLGFSWTPAFAGVTG